MAHYSMIGIVLVDQQIKHYGGMMEQEKGYQSNAYRILVAETLNCQFVDRFDDLTITPQKNGKTILTGCFTDQPALRGFLEQLWNLNITVISVERIENEN